MTAPQKELLLTMLDEAYEKQAWHGPNLRGSIRGLTARAAAWRPGPRRHSIWEIVVHAAYWKYAVRRRLLGEKRGSFPLKGSNWFARASKTGEQAWRNDIALLARMHKELRATVASLPESAFGRKSPGSRHTARRMIAGIALHDVYHAGQIQFLKRLLEK
jgi:uncharacterized damage-inducible protein DinB